MAVRQPALEALVNTMQYFDGIYLGKKVLVTGHTGFKGSWLSLWLKELGSDVFGYALGPPTKPSLFEEAEVAAIMKSSELGDIRDREKLKAFVADIEPEIVFHLAAQALVRLSYDEPAETYETNVMGTVNLLEAVRACPTVKVCQIVTSDKCYDNKEWIYPYRENDRLGGHDPYSNSKGCSEFIVSSYRQSFFHPSRINEHAVSVSSVRAGNVIGGGDWALDRIIPDCIRALEQGDSISIRNPESIRPWQHVLEPLSGYLWLAAKQYLEPGRHEEAWNFGPANMLNLLVSQVAEMVIQEWGSGSWYSEKQKFPNINEAKILKLDVSKANDVLKWSSVESARESIEKTVSWYLSRSRGSEGIQDLTVSQIRSYCEKANKAGIAWAMTKEQK